MGPGRTQQSGGATGTKGFGPLLRRLRGETPLRTVAARTGISYSHLGNIEAGRRIPSETKARHILRSGFGLSEEDASRRILEAHLLDAGLYSDAMRGLALDLAQGKVPSRVLQELARLYRSYTGVTRCNGTDNGMGDRAFPDPTGGSY